MHREPEERSEHGSLGEASGRVCGLGGPVEGGLAGEEAEARGEEGEGEAEAEPEVAAHAFDYFVEDGEGDVAGGLLFLFVEGV